VAEGSEGAHSQARWPVIGSFGGAKYGANGAIVPSLAASEAEQSRGWQAGDPADADLLRRKGTSVTEARHLATAQGSADAAAACKDGFPGRSVANCRPVYRCFHEEHH